MTNELETALARIEELEARILAATEILARIKGYASWAPDREKTQMEINISAWADLGLKRLKEKSND